ncbi:MAG: response regulator [Acidobacteriaceae bacterium]|nr:response regulator [Acidobacteriaceae bacterium]
MSEALDDLDRKCTDSELLEFILQSEFSRQNLALEANKLSRLVDESAQQIRNARSAAQAKSDFLAMMSHEIRTPLNGIIGMTAILLGSELGTSERDYVETIRSSGEALLSVVDKILDFSKIEAGRLELECAEFELAKTVETSLQIVRSTAEQKSLALSSYIDPVVPARICGDATRLRQVLLNLLSNAIKFTTSGRIDVKTELVQLRHGTCELKFTIRDQGIGISPEDQARLFQPFSQAEIATTRKFGGTGLGLAISKRLVELMGGTIGVNSRPGEGSSFWFTIQALVGETAPPVARKQPVVVSSSRRIRHDSRILLVEDDVVNQKVALLMLDNLGYRADVAANGAEALAALARKHYDLVLMDCLMPNMDGFEATRRIRSQIGYLSQLPIIAMTANAFAEDREACLSAGMTDYLSKPVNQLELERKLDFWLSGKGRPLELSVAI